MNLFNKKTPYEPPIMSNFYTRPPSPEWVKAINTLVDTAERFDGQDNDLRDEILNIIQNYITKFIEDDKKPRPTNETTTTK